MSNIWFHIHYLSGYFSGKLLKLERSEMIILILASILPDLDSVFFFLFSGFKDPTPFHAGATHTLLIASLLSTLLAAISFGIIKLKEPKTEYKKLLRFIILGIFGIGLHFIIDINTTANEYGMYHHLYFWPLSDVSFHFDLLFAQIFPSYLYFDFSKFAFLWYSPISSNIVNTLSLIINGVFLLAFIYGWIPLRKEFPWDPFIYNSERKRIPYIGDNFEIILNVLLSVIFFGLFVVDVDNSLKALLHVNNVLKALLGIA